MKTLRVIHSVSEAPIGEFFKNDPAAHLTPSSVRRIAQIASGLGILPYDDGYYRAWIHPCAMHDILADSTFVEITDIIRQNDSSGSAASSMELCGVKFLQTTCESSMVLFGKESDPLSVTYLWLPDWKTSE